MWRLLSNLYPVVLHKWRLFKLKLASVSLNLAAMCGYIRRPKDSLKSARNAKGRTGTIVMRGKMKPIGKLKMTPQYTVDEKLPREMQWLGYIEVDEDTDVPPLWVDGDFNVWAVAEEEEE